MLELERADVAQDPGAHEPLPERRGLLRLHAGQARSGGQRRLLQHRDGAREPDRPVTEACKRHADRSRDRIRSEAPHRSRVIVAGAVDATVAKPIRQPADQQRVAARSALAGVRERG